MFRVDMSHQEMERMLSELEEWYAHASESGALWISVDAAASWLRHDLGAGRRASDTALQAEGIP